MSFYSSRNPNLHCDLLKSLELVSLGDGSWAIRHSDGMLLDEDEAIITFYTKDDAEAALEVARALGPIMNKAHWEMKNACPFPQIGSKKE
jgi:hypothetical protein